MGAAADLLSNRHHSTLRLFFARVTHTAGAALCARCTWWGAAARCRQPSLRRSCASCSACQGCRWVASRRWRRRPLCSMPLFMHPPECLPHASRTYTCTCVALPCIAPARLPAGALGPLSLQPPGRRLRGGDEGRPYEAPRVRHPRQGAHGAAAAAAGTAAAASSVGDGDGSMRHEVSENHWKTCWNLIA